MYPCHYSLKVSARRVLRLGCAVGTVQGYDLHRAHSKHPIMEDTVHKVRRSLTGYANLDKRQVESAAVVLILSAFGWEPFPWDRRN